MHIIAHFRIIISNIILNCKVTNKFHNVKIKEENHTTCMHNAKQFQLVT